MIRLTRAQVRRIDRRAIEEYHIPRIVLMENAARGVADTVLRIIETTRVTPAALIVCGGGNNGGDGLAVARHLHNADVEVRVALAADAEKFAGDVLTNLNIVRAMKLPITDARAGLPPAGHGLIVDAIFG